MSADTSRTVVHADFAGQRRRFCLRIGEIEELERIGGAGIATIAMRVWTGNYHARDLIETVRLGLEGGGASEPEATALAARYAVPPLGNLAPLASQILEGAMSGVPTGEGKEAAETTDDPATSPPSSAPAHGSALAPETFAA